MSRNHLALVAVVLALVAVLAFKGGGPPPDEATAMSQPAGTAAEQAIAAAQAAGRPALLSFRSNSCIPCKAMGDILAEIRPKYEGRIDFVDISLEPDTPDMALCERYQIQVKPTTILLAGDGTILETKLGVWEPAQLTARLDQAASR